MTPFADPGANPLATAQHYDACALIAHVNAAPSKVGVRRVLDGLRGMEHRTGIVGGEGDGVGVHLDLPCDLWARWVGEVAHDPAFYVAHLFVPATLAGEARSTVPAILHAEGLRPLHLRWHEVDRQALGPLARRGEPLFLQVGGLVEGEGDLDARLFAAQLRLERETSVHVVSLSRHAVVYKVHGDVDALEGYYPDLRAGLASAITLGHSRYSTNTLPAFERVQPAAVLGHNGEINTIDRLRREAAMLGVQLTRDGSDSQDLDRFLHHLVAERGLPLFAAMEVAFPPIPDEVARYPESDRRLYEALRHFWGPYAQGPAGLITRWGDCAVFATDALGLRPLWQVPTDEGVYFASERGCVPFDRLVDEPRPLAPGEKVGVRVHRGDRLEVFAYEDLQRAAVAALAPVVLPAAEVAPAADAEPVGLGPLAPHAEAYLALPRDRRCGIQGFCLDDVNGVKFLAEQGHEPIASLGYDGPLAALAPDRQALSDYCKESVAVVTNPAMDREREVEHFSTRWEYGPRPPEPGALPLATAAYPIFPDLASSSRWLAPMAVARAAADAGTAVLEDLLARFRVVTVPLAQRADETLPQALEVLATRAIEAVLGGAQAVLLDDAAAFGDRLLPVDPHLALAKVDATLRTFRRHGTGPALRRDAVVFLRSEALRNLHDVVLAIGLGADGVCPTLLLEAGALHDAGRHEVPFEVREKRLTRLLTALSKGLEKVISTMGTHELRGYGRCFATIGVAPSITRLLEVRDFYGTEEAGLTFARLEALARRRYAQVAGASDEGAPGPRRDLRLYPKVWRLAGQVAAGTSPYAEFSDHVTSLEKATPVSLRHLLDFRAATRASVPASAVDPSVDIHAYPVYISAMSFGSQGEVAFRSYVEAAARLGVVCVNGEGGEIADLFGRYTPHRGQQVASGRFGVCPEMLNSAYVIEIKVGQGAKPGEGGHLPGKKVSPKVAKARHAAPGIDLISPSNNHDIYSIEDLAQIIEELKTTNPRAKVSVKVPVVPNIGTIAVGIAKAGADVVVLSGYDGGTGAARTHALKFVGLPVEIGVKEAHRALCWAGFRDRVELWADGGVKTGRDVLKLILLGANRCGFGTMAMVAAGCTICHSCQTDTCHVGIATQIEDQAEAHERGLKHFHPRDYETAVDQLVRFFGALGDEVRSLTGALGASRTQDLVGRADLLVQADGLEGVDLSYLLEPMPLTRGTTVVTRPHLAMTRQLTEQVAAIARQGPPRVALSVGAEVRGCDRALGTHLGGELVRAALYPHGDDDGRPRAPESAVDRVVPEQRAVVPALGAEVAVRDAVVGNGFGAFNTWNLNLTVQGGAQDGVGKCSLGGRIVVLKGKNAQGRHLDGGVGKGFAYGAQRGLFMVQGPADSRFCIRLSGAQVVAGARLTAPLDDARGLLSNRAQLKGFAFEYMTSGEAVVLGDPGAWICAGMTGGVVWVKLSPDLGLDVAAVKRRIARGARVAVAPANGEDLGRIHELLEAYTEELVHAGQMDEAQEVARIARDGAFVAIRPVNLQVDQAISTE